MDYAGKPASAPLHLKVAFASETARPSCGVMDTRWSRSMAIDASSSYFGNLDHAARLFVGKTSAVDTELSISERRQAPNAT